MKTKILSQNLAKELDKYLMSTSGCNYSVDTLMELAGLSASQIIQKVYPVDKFNKVLVCCGPGNNGGDGLVVARHLTLFGYKVEIYYPIRKDIQIYTSLLNQLSHFDLKIYDSLPELSHQLYIDAVFGFSFSGKVRDPFVELIEKFKSIKEPIASIDVPSSWEVDSEPKDHFMPDTLISLTAPKPCSKYFTGNHHYLGGRFVPPKVATKFGIELNAFPGGEQYVQL